ncbi:S-LOCUS LECTIN KINASE FAMILY PROTEIN [Salix koriyanagi]|uniref:S-LOCUS LECTIN KINASE FAMILY PROTEIN n=1 Tax=Salix koriyanagi TaxID=2511006 RepID=A0A9Q0W7D1_9ROSI|nr:S-LOCUS LECTIN KINASE FAMILY PROTEIN [Salix koriyanagi]
MLQAKSIKRTATSLSLLDHRLEGDADLEELTRICKVACWCIQDEETQRPSMGQIVQILEGVVNVNQPPIPRSLRVFDCQENIVFFTESSSSQSSQPQSHTSTASTQSKSTTSNTSPRS